MYALITNQITGAVTKFMVPLGENPMTHDWYAMQHLVDTCYSIDSTLTETSVALADFTVEIGCETGRTHEVVTKGYLYPEEIWEVVE